MVTATTVQRGDKLPDVTLPCLRGGEISFAQLRGKQILLFFWGSW